MAAPMVGFCGFQRGEPQTSEAEILRFRFDRQGDGDAHEGAPATPCGSAALRYPAPQNDDPVAFFRRLFTRRAGLGDVSWRW